MDRYRIAPGTRIDLSTIDAADTSGFDGAKAEGRAELKRLKERVFYLLRSILNIGPLVNDIFTIECHSCFINIKIAIS